MDKRTQKVLNQISRDIPQELISNLTKEIVDDSQEIQVREMLANDQIPERSKKKIRKLLEAGAFRTTDTEEDTEAIQKLDDYHTKAIKKATRQGLLKKPGEDDKFIKQRNWRLRNKNKL